MTWDELRSEAFGEVGLNPTEFYEMEREDYWLLHKGFFNKRIYEQRVFRRMVMTVIAPHVKNLPSPYAVMPLPDDDELRKQIKGYQGNVSKRSLEILKEFKDKEASQNFKEN